MDQKIQTGTFCRFVFWSIHPYYEGLLLCHLRLLDHIIDLHSAE